VGDKKILLVHETNIQAKTLLAAIERYLTELGNHRVSIEITTDEQPILDPICRCSSPKVLHEAPNLCQRCGKTSRLPPVREIHRNGTRRLEIQFDVRDLNWMVALEGDAGADVSACSPMLLLPPVEIDRETWRAIVPAVDALFEAWSR
jgi:hypothetical protein